MRALTMAAVALTAAFFGATGCDPAVDRVDGALRVDVQGLPVEVDALSILVTQGDTQTQFVGAANGGSGSVLVQTIPAGDVNVEVVARIGVMEIGRRSQPSTVVAGVETRVVVSFAAQTDGGGVDGAPVDSGPADAGLHDGGVVAPYQASVVWMLGGVSDADVGGNDRLTVDFPAGNTGFADFLSAARAHLGTDPASFEIIDAVVTVSTISGLTDLRDMFVSITASFEGVGGAVSVEFGSATPTATGAMIVVNSTHPAGLTGLRSELLSNTFTLRLRGNFPTQVVPSFSADLSLALTIRAR